MKREIVRTKLEILHITLSYRVAWTNGFVIGSK